MNREMKSSYASSNEDRMKKLIRTYLGRMLDIYFRSKHFRVEDSIIIAGAPRSGTTWLLEVLGTTPNYGIIFEPLHPYIFPESLMIGYAPRKYIHPTRKWHEGEEYIRRVLTGSIVRRYENIGIRRILRECATNLGASKLLIKFVRGNRLLPWISKWFPDTKIVLIIRHPCAVISSQIRSNIFAYTDIKTFRDRPPTLEEVIREASEIDLIPKEIIKMINGIKTLKEALAVVYSLDYYLPLRYCNTTSKKCLIVYENMMLNGEKELKRISEFLNISLSRKTFKRLRIPSTMASKDLMIKNYSQISKWKKNLTKEEIEKILRIVNSFELDFYSENLEPDYTRLRRFIEGFNWKI